MDSRARKNPELFEHLLQQAAEGLALFRPSEEAVGGGAVGDCGYIEDGRFWKLFSVFDPPDGIAPLQRPTALKRRMEIRPNCGVLSSSTSSSFCIDAGLPFSSPSLEVAAQLDLAHNETSVAFLAYEGQTHADDVWSEKRSLEKWLVDNQDAILHHPECNTSPIQECGIILLYGTTKVSGWLGGVASGVTTAVSGNINIRAGGLAVLDAGLSGAISNTSSDPQGSDLTATRKKDLTWAYTRGPLMDETPTGNQYPYSVIVRPISARTRTPWARLAKFFSSRVRSPTSSPATNRKTEPRSPGVSSGSGQESAGLQRSTRSLGTTNFQNASGYTPESLPLCDDDPVQRSACVLDEILESMLDSLDFINGAVGGWDVVADFVENHHHLPSDACTQYIDLAQSERGEIVAHLTRLAPSSAPTPDRHMISSGVSLLKRAFICPLHGPETQESDGFNNLAAKLREKDEALETLQRTVITVTDARDKLASDLRTLTEELNVSTRERKEMSQTISTMTEQKNKLLREVEETNSSFAEEKKGMAETIRTVTAEKARVERELGLRTQELKATRALTFNVDGDKIMTALSDDHTKLSHEFTNAVLTYAKEKEQLSNTIEAVTDENLSHTNDLASLKTELTTKTATFAREKDEMTHTIKTFSEQKDRLARLLSDCTDELKTLTAATSREKDTLLKTITSITEQKNKISTQLEDMTREFDSRTSDFAREKEGMLQAIATLEQQKKTLVDDLNKRNSEFASASATSAQQKDELTKTIKRVTSERDGAVSDLGARTEQLNAERTIFKREKEELTKKITNILSESRKTSSNLKSTRTRLTELSEKYANLHNAVDHVVKGHPIETAVGIWSPEEPTESLCSDSLEGKHEMFEGRQTSSNLESTRPKLTETESSSSESLGGTHDMFEDRKTSSNLKSTMAMLGDLLARFATFRNAVVHVLNVYPIERVIVFSSEEQTESSYSEWFEGKHETFEEKHERFVY